MRPSLLGDAHMGREDVLMLQAHMWQSAGRALLPYVWQPPPTVVELSMQNLKILYNINCCRVAEVSSA